MYVRLDTYIHLKYGHFPPVDEAVIEICCDAVEASRKGNLRQEFKFPNGDVHDVMEILHMYDLQKDGDIR